MYRILIVDDEVELRNGISSYFPWEEFGFTVATLAADGVEALQIIEREHIDIVLTDIVMPKLGGIDLAKEIYQRKLPIRVLILSGYMEFSYAQSAVAYGVKQYIVKPTRYNDLRDIFSQLRLELDNERYNAKNAGLEPVTKGISNAYYEKIINSAKQYIGENIRSVTLDDVAEHVHLNPYYLSNLFKLCTGTKFSDYVLQRKMRVAADMLGDFSLKIYDISLSVGYINPNNFSRAFKSIYHLTPREYRNMKQ
jgi:YesN/AraC family two-component response regulator